MSGELVAAFGDKIIDEARFSFGEEFLHFILCDVVLTKFLRQFEDLPIVLVWLADVVGVVDLDQVAAVHFAFADDFGLGEIDFRSGFAFDGLAVLSGFTGSRRKFPTNFRVFAQKKRIEWSTLLRDETLDQISLALFGELHGLLAGDL